jgi:hypothetical protein
MLKIERLSKDTFRQVGPNIWYGPSGLVCIDCGSWRTYPVRAPARSWTDTQIEAWVHDGEPCGQ